MIIRDVEGCAGAGVPRRRRVPVNMSCQLAHRETAPSIADLLQHLPPPARGGKWSHRSLFGMTYSCFWKIVVCRVYTVRTLLLFCMWGTSGRPTIWQNMQHMACVMQWCWLDLSFQPNVSLYVKYKFQSKIYLICLFSVYIYKHITSDDKVITFDIWKGEKSGQIIQQQYKKASKNTY